MILSQDRDLKQQSEQAWQLFVAGRWDDALQFCQSVILIDPDSADPWATNNAQLVNEWLN